MCEVSAQTPHFLIICSEAKLFYNPSSVEHPMQCAIPDKTKQSRRLGEAMITEDEAALACARVDAASRSACVFDVLATNDKEMVGSY